MFNLYVNSFAILWLFGACSTIYYSYFIYLILKIFCVNRVIYKRLIGFIAFYKLEL